MSTESLASSMPSQGWSCETLVQGIVKAAEVAGLSLQSLPMDQASKMGIYGGSLFFTSKQKSVVNEKTSSKDEL